MILRILDGAEDGLRFVFSTISGPQKNVSSIRKNPASFNVLGEAPSDSEEKEDPLQPIDPKAAERFFGENGI